ncbi:MAG TPA: DUF4097 family beta strand repeat-containing protein, partial [Xanthomonadaceae bacterium]|nr:DUF4097 family beta strand repeat-containing protein [Xanthomonadaceae bacterium]
MSRLLRHAMSIAIVGWSAVVWSASAFASKPVNEVHVLSPLGQVSIDNAKGAVVIRVSDKPEVRVAGALGDGVERVAVEGDRNNLRIRVINPQDKGWFSNWVGDESGETHLEITVPTTASVVLETVSAASDVKGVSGQRLRVDTVSGSVQVDASPGEAEIKSVSGDLRLTLQTDRVHAETVSGDLDLRGSLNGDIGVETVSGKILLHADNPNEVEVSAVTGDAELHTGLATRGQLKAESTSGDLKLMLPVASSVRLELSSFSGRVQSDVGVVEKPENGNGSSLDARLGKGEGSINMKS